MKILILLLLPFTLYAETSEEFADSVNSLDRFRNRMIKCNYHTANAALFKKSVISELDTVKRDCLLGKSAELDAEDTASNEESTLRRDLKASMKAADCSPLTGTIKLMCRVLKRR